MTDGLLDVVGIGNALVDVLSHAEDDFLIKEDLAKGSMTLIEADRAESLYGAMGPGVEMSGGSAGNTMAGLASLGSKGAYVGKVRDDQLGRVFAHDLKAMGLEFTTNMEPEDGEPTGRCLILVTPDAERTMNTYLGAATMLTPNDIEESQIARAKVTYMEGYLWDREGAKEAFRKAARVAHDAGQKVSLSLSDSFCVDRWRDEFLDLAEHHVDILFANEDEIKSLYQVDDFDQALQHVRGHCEVAALTRSEKGAVIVSGDEVHIVDAETPSRVVDTTGAGDLFASGFLHGFTQGMDLHRCGQIGAVAAAEIISHFGARPETVLSKLVAES
jgi:sugar/nucleoside kinase (ribokinase family)